MRLFIFIVVLVLVVPAFVFAQSLRWTLVNWKVRHDFPTVQRISPKEVAEWLQDSKREQPVLLDVRTKAEFEVSHIHGAQRVEPGSEAGALKLARGKPIVTYCSVGYRSGAFAKTLQEAGYQNVRNMSGSIFQWANEGRPLEHDGRPVEKVHPYNSVWGRLLNAPRHAAVPAAGDDM